MIALVDCNNFYASCEKVFDPALKRKAVVVLTNNDGCAIARSEEAKALGVEKGTPLFMIRDLVEQNKIVAFSSNYTLYGSMSERVMTILRSFVPRVEVYSIDEAFLDLSNFPYTDLPLLAQQIKEKIFSHTGLPVSIGVAPTKTLAKMANQFAKKHKKDSSVHIADGPERISQLRQATKLGDVWGIGYQYQKLLTNQQLKTAEDLLSVPEEWIRKNMSVMGQRLLFELKGIRAVEWDDAPPAKKNICTARSFGQLLTDFRDIQQALASHAANCSRSLRKDKTCCKKVHVFLQTNPHRPHDQQYMASVTVRLEVASNTSTEIIRYAIKGLKLIFKPGYNYLKVGCIVMDLVPQAQLQLGLFDVRDRTRDARLMTAMDTSNKYYGKDMIRYGTQSYGKKWKLRAERLSPCYTTRIDQVMKVKS